MAEMVKYLDLTGLQSFWGKVKTYVDSADAAVLKSAKDYTDALANGAVKANTDALAVLNGDVNTAGSVAKAVNDAKVALEGTLGERDAKTLEALNDRIDAAVADAKTYSVSNVDGDELLALGTNVRAAYKLVDEDGARAGEYIKVYKDSALKSVVLEGQILNFTYILADGTETVVPVDVSTFLAESEYGHGLQVVDHIVSVKVDTTTNDAEKFLTTSANGLKISGVQDAIDASVKVLADGAVKANTDAIAVLNGDATTTGSVAKSVADAINALDVDDTAVGTQVVTAVSQVDGKIAVTRRDLVTADITDLTKITNDDIDALVGINYGA